MGTVHLGDNGPGNHMRRYWWQHYCEAPRLKRFVAGMDECWVLPRVSKHLVLAKVSLRQVFSEGVFQFASSSWTFFSILQASPHILWAIRNSSTLGEKLRYSSTDSFETFPFPHQDPHAEIPELEEIGERLYSVRARYMLNTQQGLTQTYNVIKDPRSDDSDVIALRALHEEMDRAVLAAYGWFDLEVPSYVDPTTEAEKAVLSRFEDEVIDRLFALNAQRAAEERAQAEREAATTAKPAKAKGARKKKGDAGDGQGDLGIG